MTLAHDIMTPNAECIGENDALAVAAEKMNDFGIGAMPICGEDGSLIGMLTDRDIVVKAVAQGLDPETTNAGRLADGRPIIADTDDEVEQVLWLMQDHQIRRVPVLRGDRLVGIISQADIALHLAAEVTGRTVEQISRRHAPCRGLPQR